MVHSFLLKDVVPCTECHNFYSTYPRDGVLNDIILGIDGGSACLSKPRSQRNKEVGYVVKLLSAAIPRNRGGILQVSRGICHRFLPWAEWEINTHTKLCHKVFVGHLLQVPL